MKMLSNTKAELKKALLRKNIFNIFDDTGTFVPVLLACGISKALDRVWLAGLFHKLNCWGFLNVDQKFSQNGLVNPGAPQFSLLCPTVFLVYINDVPDDVICNITVCAVESSMLSTVVNLILLLISGNSLSWLINSNQTCEALWIGVGRVLLISIQWKPSLFHLIFQIALVLLKIFNKEWLKMLLTNQIAEFLNQLYLR